MASAVSPHGPLNEGDTLREGKYHIKSLLGKGGTGWVYLADEPIMEREVVIKIIDPGLVDDEVTASALVYEARAAAKLDHPNIIRVYTLEEEVIKGDKFIYLVIEYASQGDLRDAFGELVKSDVDRYKIVIDVLRGLEFAHSKGFIHRDLKPDNLFVKNNTVKIGDLGTVKSIGEKTRAHSTQGIMTPVYASPEQLQFKALDERSDIYTCGIIFYEIMTGKRPYKMFDEHLNDDPVPLITDLVPDLSMDVSKVIGKMMAKDVDERYQTIGEILADLRECEEIKEARLFEKYEKEDSRYSAKPAKSAPEPATEPQSPPAPAPARSSATAAPAEKKAGGNQLLILVSAGLAVVIILLVVLILIVLQK